MRIIDRIAKMRIITKKTPPSRCIWVSLEIFCNTAMELKNIATVDNSLLF